MSTYKIGHWNYMKFAQHKEEMVSQWEELGFNYTMTPFFKAEDAERYFDMLRSCEKHGVEAVVKDERVLWKRVRSVGEEQYRKDVRDVYETFKDFPAVHSFFVGDEPSEADMDTVATACRIVHEECGRIKAFLSVSTPLAITREELKAMLCKLIKDGQLEYLVYNCYSQGMAHEEQRQQGVESYFTFLNVFRDIKKTCNVPIWISLLGNGHWVYRAPTQDDMRWQLNTAALYGITGFIWFTAYQYYHSMASGSKGFAVNYWGDKTQTYWWMREEDLRFRTFLAPVLEGAELVEVYQEWKYWLPMGSTKLFIKGKDEIVDNVVDVFNNPLIISRFKKNGKNIVVVCNASQTEVSSLTVTFKAPYEKFGGRCFLAPGGVNIYELDKEQ